MNVIKRTIHRLRFPWLYRQHDDDHDARYEHLHVQEFHDEEDFFDDEHQDQRTRKKETPSTPLTVDLIETSSDFIVQAIVAGAHVNKLDITISRHLLIIQGERHPHSRMQRGQYLMSELQWGKFHRSIELPDEIDVNNSEAHEENGVLTIRLPKFDKHKQAKLQVRTNL